jgi:hypothetical protein
LGGVGGWGGGWVDGWGWKRVRGWGAGAEMVREERSQSSGTPKKKSERRNIF